MKVVEAEGAVGEFIHPVVLAHPETGRKALDVNPAFTTKFEGWSKREFQTPSGLPVRPLPQRGLHLPVLLVAGAVAFWDNRSVWHYALNDYPGQRRHMRRVTVDPGPGLALSAMTSQLTSVQA